MVTGDEGHEGRWCKRDEEKEEWRPGEAPAPDKADQQGAPDEQNSKNRRLSASPGATRADEPDHKRARAERLLVLLVDEIDLEDVAERDGALVLAEEVAAGIRVAGVLLAYVVVEALAREHKVAPAMGDGA